MLQDGCMQCVKAGLKAAAWPLTQPLSRLFELVLRAVHLMSAAEKGGSSVP
ncbi:MAG: hypothetical protein JWQ21_4051 [Herminiimonas sp.]|nr:hypothetical protein [Herminiimonas sp.]